MKQKLITFQFKSGNSCDVLVDIERVHSDSLNSIFIECFPRSREDQWKTLGVPKIGEELVKKGLAEMDLWLWAWGFSSSDSGDSQLEAYCTSGSSPGEEDSNG